MDNHNLQPLPDEVIVPSQSDVTSGDLPSATDADSEHSPPSVQDVQPLQADGALPVPGKTEQPQEEPLEEAPVNYVGKFQIPNGTVGKYYSTPFHMERIGQHKIEELEFDDLELIGLSFNKETKTIEGTPTREGEHIVLCRYRFQDADKNRPFLEMKINLIINPDPRSLWKNLPSDENDQYWKKDAALDGIFEERTVIAASQRGRSHAHEGKFRDDDFKILYQEDGGWYIAAVSDGAGSAKYSRKGSEIACITAVQKMSELVPKEGGSEFEKLLSEYSTDPDSGRRKAIGDTLYRTIGNSVFEAYKAIGKEAKAQGAEVRDFAATLILGICKQFRFGWFVAAYWVGDGCIGIYRRGKEIKILGAPDAGEFAGETKFFTMSDMWEANTLYQRLTFEIVDDFTAVVLMTDGITDPMFQTDNNLMKLEKWDEFWEKLSAEVDFNRSNKEADKQLLKWMDFWSVGNHDDRTLVIVY